MQIVKKTKRHSIFEKIKKKYKDRIQKVLKKMPKKRKKPKQNDPTAEDIHTANNAAKNNLLSKFTTLKSSIFKRVLVVDRLTRQQYSTGASAVSANSPKQIIESKMKINDQIKTAMVEWNEMKKLYFREARKHKSRLTKDDLEAQHDLLMQLRDHIHSVNDEAVTGISNDVLTLEDEKVQENQIIAKERMQEEEKVEENRMVPYKQTKAKFNNEWWDPLLDRKSFKFIVENDKSINEKLETVDNLVSNLKFIADAQAKEVDEHNEALVSVDYKINGNYMALTFVNRKVKNSLDHH